MDVLEAIRTTRAMRRLDPDQPVTADHLGEAPALILVTAGGRRGAVESSVYPGVQNLMLAARSLGLGTTLTTIHQEREQEVKDLLGIPADQQTFALIPVGHPLGRWGEAKRRPVAEVAHWDRWGNPPPG